MWNCELEYERSRYEEYLRSEHWKSKRSLKLELCPKCEECGASDLLEVHHRTYERLFCERMEDLMTLCRRCHGRKHKHTQAEQEVKTILRKKR